MISPSIHQHIEGSSVAGWGDLVVDTIFGQNFFEYRL